MVEDGSTLSSAAMRMMSGGVAAAGALGVVGVYRPTGDCGDGVFDEAGFIEGIGMDGDRHVVAVGHG